MKYIQLNDFGTPHKVVSVEEEKAKAPGKGEVAVKMLACPVNPAEMLLMSGRYASKPKLPYRLGIEGCGEVIKVGKDVEGLAEGDRVISFGRNNWAEQIVAKSEHVIKVPAEADPLQLGMLKVNPATAWLMLMRYADLQPGDWLIQNAANSGVGHAVIQLAKAAGFKTVNVVRRPWVVDPLMETGATVVEIDGDDLGARVLKATGGVKPKLGIDAVAGAATRRMADCLDDGSPIVNYGLLSGNPCELKAEQTIFQDISLHGFWLSNILGSKMSPEQIQELYSFLGHCVAAGTVYAPVDKTYTLDEIVPALEHAAREGRRGKILLTPNGALE